jgi:predicted HTH transcriptional regulator
MRISADACMQIKDVEMMESMQTDNPFDWRIKAIQLLEASLYPIPAELNEIDWKSGLSTKTERLAQHLSAFANQKGGGILVFGINNNGEPIQIDKGTIDNTIQLLGNIASNNLDHSISLEHDILDYHGYSLLFVFIPEQAEKPVYLRSKTVFDSYIRSAGQTIKMSKQQVKSLIAESQGIPFEQRIAKNALMDRDVLALLDFKRLFYLLKKDIPSSSQQILDMLTSYGFCRLDKDGWCITNLGAILLANRLSDFSSIKGREVIVRRYKGSNNRVLDIEQRGGKGYAVGFENLIDYIMNLSSSEYIETTRTLIPTYPRVAIREFVANALVHQDFSIEGIPITIEIFDNRLSVTNPGAPLNDVNRLIDLPPHSRNENLAQTLFLLNICERRGSGIDRAVEAIEKMFLPAPKITKGEQHTRVFLFPKKELRDMTKQEKILACYQHACLLYEDNKAINNQSVRERFKLDKNQSAVASRIIADTLEAGFIKIANTDIVSKKYATYIPYYG